MLSLWYLRKGQMITKISGLNPLEKTNVCSKCHCNSSNCHWLERHNNVHNWTVLLCVNSSGKFTVEKVSYLKSEGLGSLLRSEGPSLDWSQLDPGDSVLSSKSIIFWTLYVTGGFLTPKKLDIQYIHTHIYTFQMSFQQ